MDESARQFGEAERAKAIAIRDEQNVIIAYWDRILGGRAPEDDHSNGTGASTTARRSSLSAPPADFIAPAELTGMKAPAATRLIMDRMEKETGARRPLRVAEIHAALIKGGMEYGKDQLYTTLSRSPQFHLASKGLWGLVEWYPGATKKDSKPDGAAEAVVSDLRSVGDLDSDPDAPTALNAEEEAS
jgi:hypothetical protein